MSLVSSLRYLHLLRTRPELGELAVSAEKKFNFLSQNIRSKNRKFILNAFVNKRKSKNTFRWDSTRSTLFCEDQKITFKKDTFSDLLLEAFSKSREISIEEAISFFYQIEYDDFAYERLRAAVRRTQQEIDHAFGTQRCFQISRKTLRISDGIEFI